MNRSSSSRRRPALFDRFLASPGLALLALLAIAGALPGCPGCDPPTAPEGSQKQVGIKPVTVDGQELFGPQNGTRVTVDGQNVPFNSPRPAEGGYYVNLEPGPHALVVEVAGFTTVQTTLTVAADAPTHYDHFVTMVGSVTLHGSVVNSQTGAGVAGASIRFFRQHEQGSYGSNVFRFELTTDANGGYHHASAPTGFFTVIVSGQGYAETILRDVELTGSAIALDPIAAVPPPPAGTYRVTLTWGEEPADLDAHLTFRDTNGNVGYHVFYGNPTPPGVEASLDIDDTSGSGPETITFTPTADGTYRFSVHNYTEQSAAGASSMWYGRPSVTLYDGDGQAGGWYMAQVPRAYAFPNDPPPLTAGNTWRVFELVKSGATITLHEGLDGDTFGFFMAGGAGDTTVFLTGGPPPVKLTAGS